MARYSDETVMRYVDGELDEAACEAIETAMATDAELSRRIELFATTRSMAADALKPLIDEPVPSALQRSVETMVARAKAGSAPRGASVARILRPANDWVRLAAAACVAAVLGAVAGYMYNGDSEPRGLLFADVDRAELSAALRSVVTGSEIELGRSGGSFRAIASFRDQAQSLCREFVIEAEGMATTSVACHEGQDWHVRLAVSAAATPDSYQPASSSETLEAYLYAIGAGQPLGPAEELAAMETLPNAAEPR